MGQGRVRPVFTALPLPGIVVVGRSRHRYALPPPPRLEAPWPQIRSIQPLPHAHEKRLARLACSVGATRTAIFTQQRGRADHGRARDRGSRLFEAVVLRRLAVATTFFRVEAGAGLDSWKGPTRAAGWPGRKGCRLRQGGAPTGPGRSTCGWAKERAMARKMGPGDGKGDLLDLGNPLTRFFLCCFIYYKKDSHHNRRKACVYKDAGIPGGGL